ncbi:HNH endonuclease [Hydrogenophaga atypica]|uniref:HNH endonuclease n=1 Tax=Hydrogenophaga atypica TaxID=249409 RepID=A0ABW2QT89_9BURK
MAMCRICLQKFQRLKFETHDIGVCGRCTHYLNDSPEPASAAKERIAEMLGRGMERRAYADLESDEEWKQRRAAQRLGDMDSAVDGALPGWLNRLLTDPANRNKNFKMMRAFRRGLLRMNGPPRWSYPSNWKTVAYAVRQRDKCACKLCGAKGVQLDVHHIVYLSNYGTNQKSNLVTLCRPCHEKEHGRKFDFGEEHDPESQSPIRPPPGLVRSAGFQAVPPPPQPQRPPTPLPPEPKREREQSLARIDLTCPGCSAKLTSALETGRLADLRVRCPVCECVFSASDGLESRLIARKDPGPTSILASNPNSETRSPLPSTQPSPPQTHKPAGSQAPPQANQNLGHQKPSQSKSTRLPVVCGHCGAIQTLDHAIEAGEYVRCRLCKLPFQYGVTADSQSALRHTAPATAASQDISSRPLGVRVDAKCPSCNALLSAVLEPSNGKRIRCPVCTTVFSHGSPPLATAAQPPTAQSTSAPATVPAAISPEAHRVSANTSDNTWFYVLISLAIAGLVFSVLLD